MAKLRNSGNDHGRSWFNPPSNESGRERDLPFDIGIIADFSGGASRKESLRDRDFAEINGLERLDELVSRLRPKVNLDVQLKAKGNRNDSREIPVELEMECMSDFRPEGILNNLSNKIGSVKKLLQLKQALKQAQWKLLQDEEFAQKTEQRLSRDS